MRLTPTTRTIRYLQAKGWLADECERRITRTLKKDLFGIADVLAIRRETPIETPWDGPLLTMLLVQATSKSNVSARVKKIADSPFTPKLREMGVRIEIWGWDEKPEPRIVDVS